MLKLKYIILLFLFLLLPIFIQNDYVMHLAVLTLIFTVFGIGFNLQFGYAGVFNLGQATFFGIGAYVTAIFTTQFEMSFFLAILFSILLSAILALFIGFITLRSHGVYLAMMTLSIGQLFFLMANNMHGLTGGPSGISGIPNPLLPIIGELDETKEFYYLALFFVCISFFVVYKIMNTRLGSTFNAIKLNQPLANAVGINVYQSKIVAFVIGAAISSITGPLYASYVNFISPNVFSLHYVIAGLIIIIAGGMGRLYGPLLGAVIYQLLPELLRITDRVQVALFGLVLVLMVLFLPNGLAPLITKLLEKLKALFVKENIKKEGYHE